jgi:hypothetical protein
MKTALIMIVPLTVLSIAALGQDAPATQKTEPKPEEVRRLESVTWDLKSHTLKWTVQKGTEVNGAFVPTSADRYEIAPDAALMKVAEEKRGFEPAEAAVLHRLLDTISLYCAQSVVWWDHGEGTRVMNDADRVAPDAQHGAPPESLKPARPVEKPAIKPGEVKQKALPLGVAEVAAHPPAGR